MNDVDVFVIGKRYSNCNSFMKFTLLSRLLFVLFLLLSSGTSFSQASSKIHVLFVGNSLTSMNDLPKLVADLAHFRHWDMDYDSYLPGGSRFSQHASDQQLIRKINEGKWDWVILQEQSQLLEFEPEQIQHDVYPYASSLCQLIRRANPQANIAFYETMAAQDGDQMNVNSFPELGTYEGTQDRINANYTIMTQDNQAVLVPVGAVWKSVRSDNPSIGLYADEKHPNLTGSYLAACVFYAVIFKDRAVGLSHPGSMDEDTANYLQKMTDKILYSF